MREWLGTLAGALLLALLIRTFLMQTFYVPSGSMLPSLLIGDHVLVNKFIYGIGVPGTEFRLPGFRAPARGDIIVFQAARTPGGRVVPADRHPNLPAEDFIKRIVGLPGDTIEIRGDTLYVNGEAVRRTPTGETFVDRLGRHRPVLRVGCGGGGHLVLDDPHRLGSDRAPEQLEGDRYFMMGDNRDDSYDSRFFGSIRAREIRGPAGPIYWSWDFTGSWASLLNPLTWWLNLTERTRWGRIGQSLGCSEAV